LPVRTGVKAQFLTHTTGSLQWDSEQFRSAPRTCQGILRQAHAVNRSLAGGTRHDLVRHPIGPDLFDSGYLAHDIVGIRSGVRRGPNARTDHPQ
jgi:hypothetical protein